MPYKKVGRNKYKSPSGRTTTKKGVRAYYANKKKPTKRKMASGIKRGTKTLRRIGKRKYGKA